MAAEPVKAFCSYSHKDKQYKDDLYKHLKPLQENGSIALWHDGGISAGGDFDESISGNLANSELILLLISPDFLASAYCTNIEMEGALQRRKSQGAVVIPIICRPTEWKTYGILGRLKALPVDGKPISKWKSRDEAFVDVIYGIKTAIAHLHRSPVAKRPIELEKEFKFAGAANLQFKFVSVDTADEMLGKLSTLCDLLNIQIGTSKSIHISDEYYEDEPMSLSAHDCSLRRRSHDGRHLVTFKRSQEPSSRFGIQRLEQEFACEDNEFRKLTRDPEHFKSVFQEVLKGFSGIPVGRLRKLLTIRNSRTSVQLNTGLAIYNFCYDKFYFYEEPSGKHSEYFTEIEIELCGESPASDQKLEKLVESIGMIFQHNRHEKTKLQRGLEWRLSKESAKNHVHAAALEIVGFALMRPEDQKQTLQELNYHVKEALLEVRGETVESLPVCISMGDGMVILFEDRPDTIIPVIAGIQQRVRQMNDETRSVPFSFRTGLHAGHVFKFTDANEHLSFGGDGIQIARQVMMLGREWHVLSTPRSFAVLSRFRKEFSAYRTRRYMTESEQEIEVINLHEHEADFGRAYGNPADPISK